MTTLADLSLILFMITAADLSRAGPIGGDPVTDGALAEPVATFRPGDGAPTLAQWLANQPADPRQRLTILVRHGGEMPDEALQSGLSLVRQGNQAGYGARLIVEQTARPDAVAYLAYDREDIQ